MQEALQVLLWQDLHGTGGQPDTAVYVLVGTSDRIQERCFV